MKRQVILLGGPPTTGKSTMANLLAKHFKLPWISTDQLRDTMRLVARREDYPNLFDPENYNGEKYLTEFSAKEIAQMQVNESKVVWEGIKYFIENDYSWEEGCIIEGVHILPKLVYKDFKQDQTIKPIFLLDDNERRIRDVIFTRGLWDDADKYPDFVKEKEVEWVLEFSKMLKTEIIKYNYPFVSIYKTPTDLENVLRLLKG